MIDVSHQLKPASKRVERRILKNQHDDQIKKIYERGAELMPAEYLTVHQEAKPERKFKILAEAKQRRLARTARLQARAR